MLSETQSTSSPGKIMLTAEYAVMDGARALCIPIKQHQHLTVMSNQAGITWKSLDRFGKVWFESRWDETFTRVHSTDKEISDTLERIFCYIGLEKVKRSLFTMKTTFPMEYGVGSSSSLIACLSKIYKIDPVPFQWNIFGGSGYDVATSFEDKAIMYRLCQNKSPEWESVSFNPKFKDKLYFVFLNKKRNSREAIKEYLDNRDLNKDTIQRISSLSTDFIQANGIEEFIHLINEHEKLISKLVNEKTVQSTFFHDFKGAVKSLGAWGGDLVLVATNENYDFVRDYFKSKGFPIVIPYHDLVS
jgi:mevalonate kinase